MAMHMSGPADYHNPMADEDMRGEEMRRQRRESQLENDAFERGRMQGDLEAVRRLEAEGALGGRKTFNDTTVINNNQAANVNNVVEIERLTMAQKAAAIFGEACAIGYIVLMAIWIEEYRGGAGWSNTNNNGNRGMFNVHVFTAFVGLWFASQAYITYRLLPLSTRPIINKAWYILCHVLALTAFALSIASATLSSPITNAWSVHAWTAYLAAFVYAVHAVYSSIRVLMTRHRGGVDANEWNETRRGHLSAEQRRDYSLGAPTAYRAGPKTLRSAFGFGRKNRNATAYNADGTTAPQWSETAGLSNHRFFLVPRKKWAVTALIGLLCVVLIGVAEWQQILASGGDQFPQPGAGAGTGTGAGAAGGLGGYESTESRIVSALGLVTLAGTMAICYAAMPPRTVLAKGAPMAAGATVATRRSISMADTAPNTQMMHQQQGVEVV